MIARCNSDSKIAAKTKDVLRRTKNIEMAAWMQSKGGALGEYQSRFRGDGIEFSEVREYVPGDDTRRIDWNVSARYDDLYVKEFSEERDLSVYAVLDCSESTSFGSRRSKGDIITEIGASLIMSALRGNNGTGLGMFAQTLEEFIPAKKGRMHATRLVREMVRRRHEQGAKGTNLAGSLLRMSHLLRHKSMIFVISDYISGPFAREMRLLSASHVVTVIRVTDPHESDMPDIGYAYLEDAETGEQILVNTSKREFQEEYGRLYRDAARAIEREARTGGAAYVEITGDEPFDVTLNRHAKTRVLYGGSKMRGQSDAV